MIRHLLQLIWNQRKQNAWLWAELLLVSVFLWFLGLPVCDGAHVYGSSGLRYPAYVQHRDQQPFERSPDYIPKEKRSGRMVFIC